MSDRIPCINPRCRRTAPAAKYEPHTEVVCGKCWRCLPAEWRARYRELRRRLRFVERRGARRISCGDVAPGRPAPTAIIERALAEQWTAFKGYFTAPPAPVGLENFLREVGLS